jgi:hypothetical protein
MIAGINAAFILTTLHYGLRYGSALASRNFQGLRGRPPLVSLKGPGLCLSEKALKRTCGITRKTLVQLWSNNDALVSFK